MKKTIFAAVLAALSLAVTPAYSQRSCGSTVLYNELRTQQPEVYRSLVARQLEQSQAAQEAPAVASRTTAGQSPIPVVFHIVVSQQHHSVLGGDTGIIRRVVSQLAALNRDFNRKNGDSTLIPALFKSRYANADIQFGLANQTSANTINAGIEVKILNTTPGYNLNNGCRDVKENTAVGLPAWDPTKFLNIWIIKTPGDILGLTVSPSLKGIQFGDRVIDESDYGVVLSYGAFGSKEHYLQYFTPNIDKGRTLTHEIGHYFELRHIWGDDDNDDVNGYCPGARQNNQQVGYDDGINDTPPQSRRTYCDYPNHTGGNCPTYPVVDACSPTAPGIMFMNYMDYVDDAAMQMFTAGQVAVMRSQIVQGGASYGLTQNPGLVSVGVPKLSPEAFTVYPNPATNTIHITLGGGEKLQSIQLVSPAGQLVREVPADARREYELQTGTLPRGLYFVQCRFDEGMLSRKIVLQ